MGDVSESKANHPMTHLIELYDINPRWRTELSGPAWVPRVPPKHFKAWTIKGVLHKAGIPPDAVDSVDTGWEREWGNLCRKLGIDPEHAVPIGWEGRAFLLSVSHERFWAYRQKYVTT
jgi:hypothetical protein